MVTINAKTQTIDTNVQIPVVFAKVNPLELPSLAATTREIFSELGCKPPEVNPKLDRNVSDLGAAVKTLQSAQTNSIRDKVIGALMIAAAVALYATGLFFIITAVAFPVGGFTMYFSSLALLFPGILLITRAADSKRLVDDLKHEAVTECTKSLPSRVNFYRNNSKLASKLEDALKAAQTSLAIIKSLPVKTKTGEADISTRISKLEKAQSEFAIASKYYVQFNSIVPNVAAAAA